jgi:GNAT superfamily N-acetyltransferase
MAADAADPRNPGSRMTDIGVVVADAWQGQGLGVALVRAAIARAQARGVTLVAMDALPGNRRVISMITGHWPEARVGHSPDGVTISIALPQQLLPKRPARPATAARSWPTPVGAHISAA